MRLATYALPPTARVERLYPAVSPGFFWAQFGNTILLYGDETQWEEGTEGARRSALDLREHPTRLNKEHLHLVVQEHPHVPVILDKGRLLLVELEADRARQLAEKSPTCYGVLPLPENQVVFDVRDPATARTAPVDWIENLVNKVARPSLEANLTHLAAFPTHYSTSTHYTNAATWARNQLQAWQYTTRLQTITVNGSRSRNVIADKQGNAAGAHEVVLLTAHLDSINLEGGPTAPAPGADDNGSGSAGLLEIARAFSEHRMEHDLRFILFGGEEEGLFGSKRYVASLSASEQRRLRAVVNMDMIGTLNTSTRSVVLEGAPLGTDGCLALFIDASFCARCLLRTDDVCPLLWRSIAHHEQPLPGGLAQFQIALFSFGMLGIRHGHCEHIIKHGAGFSKVTPRCLLMFWTAFAGSHSNDMFASLLRSQAKQEGAPPRQISREMGGCSTSH
jgi:hypothetical protein